MPQRCKPLRSFIFGFDLVVVAAVLFSVVAAGADEDGVEEVGLGCSMSMWSSSLSSELCSESGTALCLFLCGLKWREGKKSGWFSRERGRYKSMLSQHQKEMYTYRS